jgi:hypothetical protein
MRPTAILQALATVAAMLLIITHPVQAEPQVTQTFELHPGWNAIFLQVKPDPADPATVFAGLPLESAWTYLERFSTAEFIQDPAEGLWNQPGWNVYLPESDDKPFQSRLTNLYAILANRAYLIKLKGTEAVTWSVTGRPAVPIIEWVPDAYNLVGLPVDPDSPPTFASFFAPSAAHTGQPVYRLSEAGSWEKVTDPVNAPIKSGEAYWIYCKGGSSYTGPLKVELDMLEGLDYADILDELTIAVENLSDLNNSVVVRTVAAATDALVYRNPDPASEIRWLPLPASFQLNTNGKNFLHLAVRRALFAGTDYENILEISNGIGSRILVPVTASAPQHSSLWIGSVTVKAVGEVNEDPLVPTPTGSEFSFRLIVHVDSALQARLLKEVIFMWEDGIYKPDPEDSSLKVMDQPGRYVLITQDDKIHEFQGSALRDGEPVGKRVSSSVYDYKGDTLPMNGGFGPGNNLSCSIVLKPDFKTNPFRHQYHPDHNNLDDSYRALPEDRPAYKEEVYTVTRDIKLEFTPQDPDGLDLPGWGYSVVGGRYTEVLSGLHKQDIAVAGTFRLHLASFIDELNPEPRN